MAFLAVVSPRPGVDPGDLRRMRGYQLRSAHYQLLFVMPGSSPRCAISRRQMRQMPNFLYTECDLPHDHALAQFTFVAVKRPDHKLTIMIFDKETAAPIDNAQVRLGCFRTVTDASGLAELSVPDGHYEVKAWMVAHELCPTTIEVTKDMTLRLEAVALPEEDPGALWTM